MLKKSTTIKDPNQETKNQMLCPNTRIYIPPPPSLRCMNVGEDNYLIVRVKHRTIKLRLSNLQLLKHLACENMKKCYVSMYIQKILFPKAENHKRALKRW